MGKKIAVDANDLVYAHACGGHDYSNANPDVGMGPDANSLVDQALKHAGLTKDDIEYALVVTKVRDYMRNPLMR